MNVLIIDTDACGLDFAYRCVEAGHKVKYFLRPFKPGVVTLDGKGFAGVERVDDWRPHMKWAKEGLIWPTHNGMYLKDLDTWKDFGFPVFAPSYRSAQLEINRGLGMEAFEKNGIAVPPYQTYKSLEEARAAAFKSKEALVFKTMGDEEDKSLTYVAHSPAAMVGTIDRWLAQGMRLKGPCMLQERIEGIEMGVSGWMGPNGFLPGKWNLNFEYKQLMPGNYGPNTGEMGTVIQYVRESKLADEVLVPLEKYLMGLGHLGDFDINCIVNNKGPHVLEATARPGWPHHQIVQASHEGDPAAWMAALLKGEDELEVNHLVAMGVVVAQPPYPYGLKDQKDLERVTGIPIYGTEGVWDQIHPWQMMMAKGPDDAEGGGVVEREMPKTTGEYIMVVSGTGKTVRQASKRVYGAVDEIKVKNMIVRNDVGQNLEEALPVLHAAGYARELTY